jgi:hypothetical protein
MLHRVMAYNLSVNDLVKQLGEQLGFLERSAASFDQGYDDEAKRLAIVGPRLGSRHV